jgi:ribosomal protein S18 acetylase RimI-like enzyme
VSGAAGALSIREAVRGDLPAILALYAQPELDDGKTLPLADAERLFARLAQYPDYRLYVAEADGAIVGSYALLIMDNLEHLGAPAAVIEAVAVAPAMQGRGVGRALMRHALTLAGQKGCYKAALSSNLKRQRAHAFYEALGFERHGYSFRVLDPGDAAG